MRDAEAPALKVKASKTTNKPYSIIGKVCPFTREPCLRQKCALWIKAHKQLPNPLYTLHYEGCGLIQNIPWTIKKETTQ